MKANSLEAKSLINDMLHTRAEKLEKEMQRTIQRQVDFYQQTKEKTLSKMLGQSEDEYSLVQNFKYQEAIGSTLREMEKSYFEYFGKPWDYVEPVTEEPVQEQPKRGRKPKAK
jgi:hypothetical protein